jgi:hypothetical protein
MKGTAVKMAYAKLEILGRTNRLLSSDRTRTAKEITATILRYRRNVFTEQLPSNYGVIHRFFFW